MSSAKRTPRYVERVPTNIRIVGPTVEAQVIPIRRVTPAYTPVFDSPAPSPRRAPAKRVPVERRPWQVLVVSPMPGAATRVVRVARWQARVMVGALSVALLATCGAVAAVAVAFQSPDLFVTSADAALLHQQLLSMEDSLAAARDEAAEANDAASAAEDSAAAALAALAKAMARPAPATRLSSRKPSITRAAREAARNAARAADPNMPELGPRSVEGLPTVGRLASGFSRARRHPVLRITRPHLGVDVAAPRGTPISAPAPGRVSFVGRKFGFGLVVEILHAEGVKSRYAHLRSAAVTVGAQVARGDVIAAVGSSGITTGPHLHYEVLVRGRQVDPLRFRIPQGEPAAPDPAAGPNPAAASPVPDSTGSTPAATGSPAPPTSAAPLGSALRDGPALPDSPSPTLPQG